MLSKLLSGSKPNPEDLEKLLAQGRRYLWRNERENARQTFQRVGVEVKTQLSKNGRSGSVKAVLETLQLDAELGMWALNYLDNPQARSTVSNILDHPDLNANTTYFIAKVFQSQDDLSDEALLAYRLLLERYPSEKIARRIAEIISSASFSFNAYRLLQIIVKTEPDNYSSAGRLCRWHIRLGDIEQAAELATRILQNEPDNIDANRALGAIAERNQNWEMAARHYHASGDHLRVAVVAAKSGNLTEAKKALDLSQAHDQASPTWLYYQGWVAFQQQDYAAASWYWNQLRTESPKHSSGLSESITAAETQRVFEQIQSLEVDIGMDLSALKETPYQSALALQVGAAKVMLTGELERAKPLLQFAAQARGKDITSLSYLLLEHAFQQDSRLADKQIYLQFLKHYQDASLFLWLRGLTMLRQGDREGYRYLAKASQEGIGDHHLPKEAIQATLWVAARLCFENSKAITQEEDLLPALNLGNRVDITNKFLSVIAPSYVLEQIAQSQPIPWLDEAAELPTIGREDWHNALAAYFIAHKQWNKALAQLTKSSTALKVHVIDRAVADALNRQNVNDAARYVRLGLELDPGNQEFIRLEKMLSTQIYQIFWEEGGFDKLDFALEEIVRSNRATTAIYHDLALVYTRLALLKDDMAVSTKGDGKSVAFSIENQRTPTQYTGFLQDQAHNDYWLLAIGCWAVVLSDEAYWGKWVTQRGQIYGETPGADQVLGLIEQTLPRMLREYHEEKALKDGELSNHHRYYASIIEREIELTRAMRYLIRVAERQQLVLPESFVQFVSPLLLKEYGYSHQAREVISNTDSLNLSPYEADLLREAFSPLAEVKALTSIQDYEMALSALRSLMDNPRHADRRKEYQQELHKLLELAARQRLEREDWEKTLRLVVEANGLQPGNAQIEKLQVQAAIGLANSKIKSKDYDEAIRVLENVRSGAKQRYAELDTLLAESYVEWGREALHHDDLNEAQVRFEQALKIDKSNARAKQNLAGVYHDKALEELRADQLTRALATAEKALGYADVTFVNKLLAMILHDLGVQAVQSNSRSGRNHFERAFNHAQKYWEQDHSEDSLHFYVEIGTAYVLCLYNEDAYLTAIKVGEELLQWRIDHSSTSINLPKLMSAVYTNHGAKRYNSGARAEGRELMKKALVYDPTNQLARKNLSQMGWY